MSDYVMPVKAIKHILREEHNRSMASIRRNTGPLLLIENYLVYGMDLALDMLEKCETYNDLEEFIGCTRRMSLQEWIDSL